MCVFSVAKPTGVTDFHPKSSAEETKPPSGRSLLNRWPYHCQKVPHTHIIPGLHTLTQTQTHTQTSGWPTMGHLDTDAISHNVIFFIFARRCNQCWKSKEGVVRLFFFQILYTFSCFFPQWYLQGEFLPDTKRKRNLYLCAIVKVLY